MVVVLLLVALAAVLLVHRVLPPVLAWRRIRSLTSTLPGPPGYPIIGNLLELVGPLDDLYDKFASMCQKYGPTFCVRLGHLTFVFVMDADDMEVVMGSHKLIDKSVVYGAIEPLVGTGLGTLGGDVWRRHRKAITPSLHLDILKDFVHIFNQEGVDLATRLGKLADQEVVFDVTPLCGACANSTVCQTVMSMDQEGDDSDKKTFIDIIPKALDLFMHRVTHPWLLSDRAYSLTSSFPAFQEVRRIANHFTRRLIQKKRKSLKRGAAIPNPNKGRRQAFLDHMLSSEEGAVLSDAELAEEVKSLVSIGSASSMDTLSLIIYTLAVRRDIQERIFQELEAIFGAELGRPVQPSDLAHMQYIETFIKEVLRYFPVVPLFARSCPEDLRLPSGPTIPAGCQVAFWLPYVHRDPRWWCRPEEFDPGRFLPENSRGRHPFAFVPFSAGPRNCIGQRYAMMFLKTVVAVLVARLRFALPPDGPQRLEDVRLKMNLTVSVRNGANIRVSRRPALQAQSKQRQRGYF